jgi:hypothetical protein
MRDFEHNRLASLSMKQAAMAPCIRVVMIGEEQSNMAMAGSAQVSQNGLAR